MPVSTVGNNRLSPSRQLTVEKYGSPAFSYLPTAISAGADDYIEVTSQFPEAGKYAPLDTIHCINTSGELISLRINGTASTKRYVPAGTISSFDNTPIHSLRVTNEDGATATANDEIIITLSRAALSADELARREA